MVKANSWAITKGLLFLSTLLSTSSVVNADNPIVQTVYTADPVPIVHNGRVYLFTSHDEDGSTNFNMKDWRLFSSNDMVNWQHHPSPMGLTTFSWANDRAWAGQVASRNGKFYYYVPVAMKNGRMAIGVGVSDNILGPYRDALGKPLVENNEIDPTVFIDDDGQAYLYWGNPGLWYVKLNQDMISYSGGVNKVQLTTAGFGSRPNSAERPTNYEEGPWLYKRNGMYYMIYAANCCSEDIRYSTGPTATGPWTYRGVLMAHEGKSFTNHPAVIDFENKSYFFYHNGALPGGSGYTRSVAVESFQYNSNGLIPQLRMSTTGPAQVRSLDPYTRQEAETIAWTNGVETEACSEGGLAVSFINNGDYIKVKGVAFGNGAQSFSARVASANSKGGKIELRLGSETGKLVGTCTVPSTGGWQTWKTVDCPVSGATGTSDLFLRFTGEGSDYLFNVNWWQFKTTKALSREVVNTPPVTWEEFPISSQRECASEASEAVSVGAVTELGTTGLSRPNICIRTKDTETCAITVGHLGKVNHDCGLALRTANAMGEGVASLVKIFGDGDSSESQAVVHSEAAGNWVVVPFPVCSELGAREVVGTDRTGNIATRKRVVIIAPSTIDSGDLRETIALPGNRRKDGASSSGVHVRKAHVVPVALLSLYKTSLVRRSSSRHSREFESISNDAVIVWSPRSAAGLGDVLTIRRTSQEDVPVSASLVETRSLESQRRSEHDLFLDFAVHILAQLSEVDIVATIRNVRSIRLIKVQPGIVVALVDGGAFCPWTHWAGSAVHKRLAGTADARDKVKLLVALSVFERRGPNALHVGSPAILKTVVRRPVQNRDRVANVFPVDKIIRSLDRSTRGVVEG
ncbi:hypothetical protein HG531_004700 [Fusarium graminearum]|nr:hypothetical protein HG531_004700 [Fusarium graminearum]